MTDRPPTAAPMLGTTVPADAGTPGYYPDPSVPGFVRYWAGHAWVPGTSRAAPAPGEQLQPPRFVARYIGPPPYSVPPGLVPAVPAGPLIETGPIYLDETGAHTAFNMPAHPDPVEAAPAAAEVRGLDRVGPAPWAVTGNGLQPAAAESWATAAALRLGPVSVPEAAVVAPRRGGTGREAQERGRAPVGAPVRQVREGFAAGAEAEIAVEPEVRVPEPVVAEEAAPRPAQPLGGTPWHGGGGGGGGGAVAGGGPGGDGSVGMSAGPASLYEPRPAYERVAAERSAPEPLRGASASSASVSAPASASVEEVRAAESAAGSGWRADPRAQRGLMDTGEAPRRVSWGVDGAPGEVPAGGPSSPSPSQSSPVERAAREPRVAHVTSERVRPPRAAHVEERPAARVRGGVGAAGARGEGRRPAVPAPVPAGLAARAFGWLVDGAVTLVVGAAVAVPMAATVSEHVRKKIEQAQLAARLTGRQHQVWLLDQVVLGRLAVVLGVLVLFALLYQVLPVARTGQTFGKRLARIRVVAAGSTRPPGFGRSLLRWLVGGLGTVLLLGLFTPLLDRPARRGWHDRAARTRVVRVGRR
ncbi:RDD family protein [Kitasatospora sp. NPDC048407]|uniref:RDD family protein n=1 Tax=Kitasatospora sp. NPDC048407 TaxID=3364051 RepID=UPI00372310C4